MKFVRDELFYYSRDENQFLRRRRAFVFVLFPDLLSARFKDPELPFQRIVVLQSAILALVRRLSEWLSTDAIRFEVLFVQDDERKPLAEEATLTQLLLREPIERGDAIVEWLPDHAAVAARLQRALARLRSIASPPRPNRSSLTWTTWWSRNWWWPALGRKSAMATEWWRNWREKTRWMCGWRPSCGCSSCGSDHSWSNCRLPVDGSALHHPSRTELPAGFRRMADNGLTREPIGPRRMSVLLSDPTILLAGVVLALFQFLAALPWLYAIDPKGFRDTASSGSAMAYVGCGLARRGLWHRHIHGLQERYTIPRLVWPLRLWGHPPPPVTDRSVPRAPASARLRLAQGRRGSVRGLSRGLPPTDVLAHHVAARSR